MSRHQGEKGAMRRLLGSFLYHPGDVPPPRGERKKKRKKGKEGKVFRRADDPLIIKRLLF